MNGLLIAVMLVGLLGLAIFLLALSAVLRTAKTSPEENAKRRVQRYASLIDGVPLEDFFATPVRGDPTTPAGLSSEFDRIIRSIPQVSSVEDVIKRMPRHMRQQLSGPLGHEIVTHITAVAAQELQAVKVRRWHEIEARLALEQAKNFTKVSISYVILRLEYLRLVQEISSEYSHVLGGEFVEQMSRQLTHEITRLERRYGQLLAQCDPPARDGSLLRIGAPPRGNEQTSFDFDDFPPDEPNTLIYRQ